MSFLSILFMQVSKISYNNKLYPDMLREIASPPKQLYVRGELPPGPYVAIVGTRRITDYGKRVTYQLAGELAAAGAVIVSGLALGVDGVAHRAALEARGKTIAVLAGGLDRIYPSSHTQLANQIELNGALVSEYAPGEEAYKSNFVARNRIVAGLSLALIVTESPASGGSLITAKFALNEGREVFAVPGDITRESSAGANNLLRTGQAGAVTSASDIIAMLNLNKISHKPVKAQSKEEALILELLDQGHNSSDALIRESKLSSGQFANIITLMEISGKVRNIGAGQWMNRLSSWSGRLNKGHCTSANSPES
jgi:DNA processing protein